MSREYDMFLKEHRENVANAFYWISENLTELLDGYDGEEFNELEDQICRDHDSSKNLEFEYNAYDRYFYGKNRSFEVVQEFNYAWLYHIHLNPHHWQHWVLINDDPECGEIVLDMPYRYILEMICDWWAFSWRDGNLTEIFKWYDEHKDYMKLSDYTRKMVENILSKIREKLAVIDTVSEESED